MDGEKVVALELQPCFGNRSGIGSYTYELATRMRDDERLTFCGNLFNFMDRNDNSEVLDELQIPVNTCKLFPYGIYRRVWKACPVPYEQLFPKRADLSIFFNFIVPPHVKGKVITTIYDMTYLRFPETMNRKNLRRIKQGIDYSAQRSDHIITISEFSKKEIVTLLKVPEEKVSVVYCAPAQAEEPEDFRKVAEKFAIHAPYLLYVGTIEPRKNLVRLLRAFEQLKVQHGIPHKLVLAGGSGWNNEDIYETAKDLSCMKDILFTGFVTGREKNALYQQADAFVFPSLYEGFGIPPLEAMHFGCPVVCARAASLPEVVGDAAVLVDPLDEQSIADGVWQVIGDCSFKSELIRKGYEQEKKFTWDAAAEKLKKICHHVLEENR